MATGNSRPRALGSGCGVVGIAREQHSITLHPARSIGSSDSSWRRTIATGTWVVPWVMGSQSSNTARLQ